MAQTTLAASSIAAVVRVSTTGTSAWTDLSGASTGISFSGGELNTGEAFTLDGNYPVITAGKFAMVDATMSMLYTSGTTAPDYLGTIETWQKNRTKVYLQFSPEGTADWTYTSDAGYFVSHIMPEAMADSADPLAVELTFRTPKFTRGDTV